MKRSAVLSILLVVSVLSGCATNRKVGSVLGGVGGLALGSQIGGGTGRLIATGVGTVAGFGLGEYVGSSMDRADELYAQRSIERAVYSNQQTRWVNTRTGRSGIVTPHSYQSYQDQRGRRCVPYTFTIVQPNGEQYQGQGQAC